MNEMEYFQNWLDRYVNFERAADARLFRLEKTARLAEMFGHPERSYKTYHITGSKGKGSLSKMLSCILAEMDNAKPVGVYASPHVYDFRERVAAADGFLPDAVYDKTVKEFTEKVDAAKDTQNIGSWFELNAAFAFLTFKNAGCKHAVFEVGMGGRLDATNVIKPEICGITEIELEHTEFLGDTLEKIAAEKAGIIKPHTPVVVAAQKNESVRQVFREVAAQNSAPIYFVDELACAKDVHFAKQRLCATVESGIFARPLEIKLKLLSKVQIKNAMQAALMAKILYPELKEEIIERGLSKATLPGRFEIRGNIILDGAHTTESLKETLQTFDNLFEGPKNLLFGCAAGKDLKGMIKQVGKNFGQVFVTRPGDFKKCDFTEIKNEFSRQHVEINADYDFEKIIKLAVNESKGKTLLVTGSFYLLDEVNKILNSKH